MALEYDPNQAEIMETEMNRLLESKQPIPSERIGAFEEWRKALQSNARRLEDEFKEAVQNQAKPERELQMEALNNLREAENGEVLAMLDQQEEAEEDLLQQQKSELNALEQEWRQRDISDEQIRIREHLKKIAANAPDFEDSARKSMLLHNASKHLDYRTTPQRQKLIQQHRQQTRDLLAQQWEQLAPLLAPEIEKIQTKYDRAWEKCWKAAEENSGRLADLDKLLDLTNRIETARNRKPFPGNLDTGQRRKRTTYEADNEPAPLITKPSDTHYKYLERMCRGKWTLASSVTGISDKPLSVDYEENPDGEKKLNSALFLVGVANSIKTGERTYKYAIVSSDLMSDGVKNKVLKGERVSFTPGELNEPAAKKARTKTQ